MPKNTFLKVQKNFCAKNIVGTFCTCTKVACAKKTLGVIEFWQIQKYPANVITKIHMWYIQL